MRFLDTELAGALIIDVDLVEDERGFFARTLCHRDFHERGLHTEYVQQSISHNRRRGGLRGVHFQTDPHAETKLVRCIAGSLYDLIVDLRPKSPTFGRWQAFELTARNRRMLYIPEGFGHGFQTLEDDTDVFYQMSAYYDSSAAGGVRWDDPFFAFEWPCEVTAISARDQTYEYYRPGVNLFCGAEVPQ